MLGLALSVDQMYHILTQTENANAFLAINLTSKGIVFLVIQYKQTATVAKATNVKVVRQDFIQIMDFANLVQDCVLSAAVALLVQNANQMYNILMSIKSVNV